MADPGATATTTPALVTWATVGLLLVQTPSVEGLKVVFVPTQITMGPVKVATGFGFIVTATVGSERHCDEVSLNRKVVCPAATPNTTPLLDTVATDGLADVHKPPEVGDTDVDCPAQMVPGPVSDTMGLFFTEIG